MAALLLSKCVSSVGLLQLICTIQLLITVSEAAPKIYHYKHHQQTSHTQNNKNKDESAISHDDVYNYLMEFDYLPKSDIETGALRTEEQLKDAIRSLQRFGNIPATGEIDADTRRLIMRPRCGVGDGQDTNAFSPDNTLTGQHHNRHRFKRFALQGSKWDKTDLTWSFVNQSMSDAGEFRRALSQALGVWERSSKLTFREVYSDQADIQVLFARRDHGDGYKFDGPGHVLAHAFYPGVGRGGDAHFDADEDWVFGNNSGKGTNFRDVALHEFGHSLGLGHSSDNTAIMFPWYQGYEIDGFLPDDDRLAIQELYGSKQKTWGPYNPRTRPTTTTTTTTTTTMRPREYYPQYPSYNPWYNQQGQRNPQYPVVTPRPTTTTTTTTTMRPRQYYPEVPDREPPKYPSYQPSYNNPGNRNPSYYPSATPSTTTTTTTTTTRRTTPRRPSHYPTKNYHYHTNKHHATKRPNRTKPDNCMTRYDAIAMFRRELFIFREQFLWRLGERGLYTGFPLETRRLWTALPENFTKIDAAYENRRGQFVFFIGRHYYVFDSTTLVPGYPKPLTALGLPASVSHIDAAFTWGHNNRTYFFSKTLYWRFDEDLEHVELDYPRDMSIWSGIGYNIDAAFQYTNGKTYFFKNLGYWEFNDNLMMVAHPRPKLSGPKWMNCPRRNDVSDFAPLTSELNETESVVQEGNAQGRALQSSASSHWMSLNCFSVSFVLAILTKSLLLDSY